MAFYASRDADDGCISVGANISAFDTREVAETYLREPYRHADSPPVIETGRYSDCWLKCSVESGPVAYAPFQLDDMLILAPGQHPGGKELWLTPQPDVLIAVSQ